MKKYFVSFVFLFLVLAGLFAGIMETPHSAYIIKTEYFDIIFPEESMASAKQIADAADELYLKAKNSVDSSLDFRTIVVFVPETQKMSAVYTPKPFHRIIIYDSPSSLTTDKTAYLNSVTDAFYRELYRAVSISKTTKFWRFIAFFLGDKTQPAAFLNMPYTFLEGVMDVCLTTKDSETSGTALFDYENNIRLLIQAKIEGNFPDLVQVKAGKNTYVNSDFAQIAASLFTNYLQSTYGIDKFIEYWTELGKVNFFRFENGAFKKVYGFSMKEAWKLFEQQIEELAAEYQVEELSQAFCTTLADNTFENLIKTKDGYVWYNPVRKQVEYTASLTDMDRKSLFSINELESMSVVSEGNMLCVNYFETTISDNIKHLMTKVYDLENRKFLKDKEAYSDSGSWTVLKHGAVVRIKDNFYKLSENEKDFYVKNLRRGTFSKDGKDFPVLYCDVDTFEENCFTRTGIITLSESFQPEDFYFTDFNAAGGAGWGGFDSDSYYFVSHKSEESCLYVIPENEVSYKKGNILKIDAVSETEEKLTVADFAEYGIEKYHTVDYLQKLGKLFFWPVKDISLEKDLSHWLGTGISIYVKPDPYENQELTFSVAAGFIPETLDDILYEDGKGNKRLKWKAFIPYDNYTFTLWYKNTLTPVELSSSAFGRFNSTGEYTVKALVGVDYRLPVKSQFAKVKAGGRALFEASTDYWNENQSACCPSLWGFPYIKDSYKSIQFKAYLSYTDIHQTGWSALEKKGIESSLALSAVWDLNYLSIYQQKYGPSPLAMLRLGCFADYETVLFPGIKERNGWVFSMPLRLYTEVFFNNKYAFLTDVRILVAGKEIQNGFDSVKLYFPRAAVYLGAQASIDYKENSLLDLRAPLTFEEFKAQMDFTYTAYLEFDLYLTPVLGKFASWELENDMKLNYEINSNNFTFNYGFKLKK